MVQRYVRYITNSLFFPAKSIIEGQKAIILWNLIYNMKEILFAVL